MAAIEFKNLWDSHPKIQENEAPCSTNGKSNFSDQCAIRLGVCLSENGVNTLNLVPKKRHCWHHESSSGHVLAAEELARGLDRYPISGITKKVQIDPKTYPIQLAGKTGIIFFKDFWQREGESVRNRSGDHIDLWNGSRLTDWRTWFFISAMLNTGGKYTKSKEIWFWSVR